MKSPEIICLECPLACRITVKLNANDEIVSIEGFKCKRGEEYAKNEIKDPRRILTSTVRILSMDEEHPLLPVRTASPIPKKLLEKAMVELANVTVSPPIKIGDVIVKDILGTGVDVISSTEGLK